ncbi:hypothetical protein L915_16839, partial [Phytophthora nicotianae]
MDVYDCKLLEWVTDMRKNNVRAITTRCLLLMSVRFIEDRSEQAAIEYLRRFRVRNMLSVRRITHKGQRKRSELQVGHAMRYKLEAQTGSEKLNHFYNMDQTSIFIDMNPKQQLLSVGSEMSMLSK